MSDKPWKNDRCEAVQAYFTIYRVPVAAALWCGVPPDEVEEELALCTDPTAGIYTHPYISCLAPRCRAIHEAIDCGLLPCSRENGKVVQDHVAKERRHVSRQHLKEWIAEQFPSDKPAFLFDEIERTIHPAISLDAYQTLQAERDALQIKLEKIQEENKKLLDEKNQLASANRTLLTQIQSPKLATPRAETTYLNIIGALVAVTLGKCPNEKTLPIFSNQNELIGRLLENYEGKAGIAQRTLEEKFAQGKKSLDQ